MATRLCSSPPKRSGASSKGTESNQSANRSMSRFGRVYTKCPVGHESCYANAQDRMTSIVRPFSAFSIFSVGRHQSRLLFRTVRPLGQNPQPKIEIDDDRSKRTGGNEGPELIRNALNKLISDRRPATYAESKLLSSHQALLSVDHSSGRMDSKASG